MTTPIRTIVADDHAMFLEGIVAILAGADEIDVVAAATTGTEAIAAITQHQPDVALVDLMMPDPDGIEVTTVSARESPSTAVIIVTMIDDDEAVFSAMCAGARGYLLKGAGTQALLRAIRGAAAGEVMFSAGIADRVLALFDAAGGRASQRLRAFPELTQREYEILQLLTQGLTNAEIARHLSLAPKTIANNLSNVFDKLQVSGRAQAIVKAHRAGLGG